MYISLLTLILLPLGSLFYPPLVFEKALHHVTRASRVLSNPLPNDPIHTHTHAHGSHPSYTTPPHHFGRRWDSISLTPFSALPFLSLELPFEDGVTIRCPPPPPSFTQMMDVLLELVCFLCFLLLVCFLIRPFLRPPTHIHTPPYTHAHAHNTRSHVERGQSPLPCTDCSAGGALRREPHSHSP